jgi:hypothetical protein
MYPAAVFLGRDEGQTLKFQPGARVRINDGAAPDFRGREGVVKDFGSGRCEYRLEFRDGGVPSSATLFAGWLEPVE